MRKLLVPLAILAFSGFAMAQTYTSGTGLTGVDKLGAHQNGGRGCTGCHAPHSGGAGAGGNKITGQTVDTVNMGNDALWGEDLGPLYGQTLTFGDSGSFPVTLPYQTQALATAAGSTNYYQVGNEEVLGIMTCLSCHDGNIAKGGMMVGTSWEQRMGLLPTGLYGPNPIPTLLGNDGTAAGHYNNDHPVGPLANLGAVRVASNFVYTAGGCSWGDCLKVSGTATKYQNFVAHYGAPNIISNGHGSPVVLPDTNPADAYVVCTTCHTPHSMYTASANADAPINGAATGTYPSYFFVAAPYNPGSNPNYNQASSATQFCRQCHFSGAGGANENSGINTVTTAF